MRRGMIVCLMMGILVCATTLEAQTRGSGTSGTAPSRGASSGTTTPSDGGTAARGAREDGDSNSALGQRSLRGADAATLRSGRFEFVTSGPPGQAAAAANALTQAGAGVIRSRSFPNLRRHVLVVDLRRVPLGQARQILANVAPQTQIDLHHFYRYAQSNPRLYAAAMVAPSVPQGCRVNGLRVGIIDGPVSAGHPALAPARVVSHSVLLPRERADNTKHGTGVASLIAGEDPRGALTGFSRGVNLFAVAAFAREKRGAAADVERVAAALDWLLAQRVRLVNMSFAGPANAALDDVIGAATARGAVLIAAAGNRGSGEAFYPAAFPSVIAVTAIDAAGRRYRKANHGRHIEFAAPGVDLYVANARGGGYASGTSFAAPIVTALAAQAMVRGAGSTDAVRRALRQSSRDLGPKGRDTHFGWGLVQSRGC